MQIMAHSCLTLLRPRRKNWRKALEALISPKTGSTICFRNRYGAAVSRATQLGGHGGDARNSQHRRRVPKESLGLVGIVAICHQRLNPGVLRGDPLLGFRDMSARNLKVGGRVHGAMVAPSGERYICSAAGTWSADVRTDDHIERVRIEIRRVREMLEPLEAGRLRTGERKPGGLWRDTTEASIAALKRTVKTLESIRDQYDAKGA